MTVGIDQHIRSHGSWPIPHHCKAKPLPFFFNAPATTEIYTLSLHDALPISIGLPIAYGLAVLFVEPFFVAAGFAMYLNRRAEIEAWDIEQDRKSTRLNSSHTVISYAVFCLKKKKRFASDVTC